MIFGKTYEQRSADYQALLKKRTERVREFAWTPVRLTDGRIAWLQFVWVDYKAYFFNGQYVPSFQEPDVYLTKDGNSDGHKKNRS